MKIRGVFLVTPVSTTQRIRPTRWHPRPARTARAPKALRCWRRHSNLASVCTCIFRMTMASSTESRVRRAAKFAGKLTHDSPARPPCPIGVGVGFASCDLVLIRRPSGRYRATSKIERIRTLDPWSEAGLPSQLHQLTTERGCHFRFTVLTEILAID
jgi:hypothetical protein